jgi:hypothetical protein
MDEKRRQAIKDGMARAPNKGVSPAAGRVAPVAISILTRSVSAFEMVNP